MLPSVRDLVRGRLAHVAAGVTKAEGDLQEPEPPIYTVDLEDHAMRAVWRWQIDLQAVRQLGAVRPFGLAGLELIDCDAVLLELATRILGDTTGAA
jgi:hypothetical protein